MEAQNRIIRFGKKFSDRLDNELLEYDLDYINHNETVLAFETVCDHLCDYDVPISEEEFKEALSIASDFDMPLGDLTIAYLKKLIRK